MLPVLSSIVCLVLFFIIIFYFLMFTFHNLLVWINNNSRQIATFILVGYSFVNSYRQYSERPITNHHFWQWDDFHTLVDQRIEVWNNGPFMKIAFNMLIFCGNLVKQFVDSLEESSLYFLKDKKSTSAKKQSTSWRSQTISCNV